MKAAKQKSSMKNVLKELKENESSISMVLGGLVVLVVGVLLFNYFKQPGIAPTVSPEPSALEGGIQYEQQADGSKMPKNLPESYTVVAGDHLWGIAEKFYGSGYNWVDIAKANALSNASVLFVGRELTMPKVTVREVVGMKLPAPKGSAAMAEGSTSIAGDSYTVVAGDHLWSIAVRAYGDGYAWSKIWKANTNTIRDPGKIEVGMTLILPR